MYYGQHKGADPKPEKREKKPKPPLKRTGIKRKPGKIKKHSETSLRAMVNLARVVFQKWIVKRDMKNNKVCISCGAYQYKRFGGHYLKAEIYTGLIFNEHNCWSQCDNCNRALDGNVKLYRLGLIARIGRSKVEYLESIADANREYKWSRSELQQIIERYTTKETK